MSSGKSCFSSLLYGCVACALALAVPDVRAQSGEISPDGAIALNQTHNTFVLPCLNHVIVGTTVHDRVTGKAVHTLPNDAYQHNSAHALSPDARYFIRARGPDLVVYDLEEDRATKVDLPVERGSLDIEAVSYLKDKWFVAFWRNPGYNDGASIVNLKTNAEFSRLRMEADDAAQVDPQGLVAAVFGGGDADVYDLRMGRKLKSLERPDGFSSFSVTSDGFAFSPDSTEIAAHLRNVGIVIWNTRGEVVQTITVPPAVAMRSVRIEWSPNGKAILVAGTVYDRETGLPAMTFQQPTFYTMPIVFAGDTHVWAPRSTDMRRGDYVRVRIPWERIRPALTRFDLERDTIFAPGKSVRLEIQVGRVYFSSAQKVTQAITEAVTKRLKRYSVKVDPNAQTTLQIKYGEAKGERMKVVGRLGRDTGKFVHDYKGYIDAYLLDADRETRWHDKYTGTDGGAIDGVISDRTVRDEAFDSAMHFLDRMSPPKYVMRKGLGFELPVQVNLGQ